MSDTKVDINQALLRIYAYYRTLLGCILLLAFYSGVAPYTFGQENPDVFVKTAIVYTIVNIFILIALWLGRFKAKTERIFGILLMDISAIILAVHASGGMGNGLVFLLLVCVATGGILLRPQLSIVIASVASLSLIAETLYNINSGVSDPRTLFSAGSLGIILFATALSFNYLNQRLRQSAAETAIQTEHARHLEKIAQLIVERMQTGVVVCGPDGNVEVINQSARKFLNWHNQKHNNLEEIPPLAYQLNRWMANPKYRPSSEDFNENIRLSFSRLDPESHSQTVIFIEDNRALTQRAQQLKQASLGRLTASIAHEVRNPLGAISHAGQLLSESSSLDSADRRLTEIIDTHAKRVNQIIENVMQISRGKTAQPEPITLNEWLPHYLSEYKNQSDINADIELELLSKNIQARFDISQLRQILNNLCDNGLRHGHKATGEYRLLLRAGIDSNTSLPFLEVIDFGEGIPADKQATIFEPFFTTEATGSGLGLYLSKALSEANHANLEYKPASGLSCFRLSFAHPNRIY